MESRYEETLVGLCCLTFTCNHRLAHVVNMISCSITNMISENIFSESIEISQMKLWKL